MYIFICLEISNILVIDKISVKGGGNVTECLVKDSPPGGFHQTSRYGSFPYWDLPPPT